ncbi:hypothetical protein FWF74_03765 [Candidatus Saccharibacteria bacterium]|nr:hypothetical protein [Candidatus Saccharibacteria bacterium]MCL1963023.1 hypothetical protein [Candidatus Saccharibacteria bacterium]
MKWIAISGSWRLKSAELYEDLVRAIDKIVASGDGVVSGGALGVDYFATEKMLNAPNWRGRLKIIIPTPLEIYKRHYFKRADEGVITHEQAKTLIEQLTRVQGGGCLIEMDFDKVCDETYFARNTEVVKNCDELLGFQINDSRGVQNTVDTARVLGKNVVLKKYHIEENS